MGNLTYFLWQLLPLTYINGPDQGWFMANLMAVLPLLLLQEAEDLFGLWLTERAGWRADRKTERIIGTGLLSLPFQLDHIWI